MSSPEEPTAYDESPYPSYTHKYSHPERLATHAILHGLNPAPPGACRVLELGCGDGSNLLPMAWGLPGSRFTGADLSGRAIERGKEAVRDLGLTNIELRHANILEIDRSWGEFDYIIAHGVFSWVPPEVREKILTICQEQLAPHGVAFISYLSYPGAHVRAMLREMMIYHAGDTQDTASILAAGKEMAAFIAGAGPAGDLVQRALHAEAARVLKATPEYIVHDDLADWNAPYYFIQFTGMAAARGLQFLAEGDATEMMDLHLPPPVRETLARIAPDRLQREQYLDFLKARRFRQTLLCRAGHSLTESASLERVPELWVASPSNKPDGPIDLTPGVEVAFVSPRGPKLETALPAGKAALSLLIDAWPGSVPFAEILTGVREQLSAAGIVESLPEDFPRSLAEFLNHLNSAGLVEFHSEPSRQCRTVSERPQAAPMARWQARRGNVITSLRHVGLTYEDQVALLLIPLLDGTRTREDLVREMLVTTGAPGLDPASERAEMTAAVNERLQRLAQNGILIA